MKLRCTCCKATADIRQGEATHTPAQLAEAAPEWSLANIVILKDGTVATGQLINWCPCCKKSQNCNG